jgi:hypothetical protein
MIIKIVFNPEIPGLWHFNPGISGSYNGRDPGIKTLLVNSPSAPMAVYALLHELFPKSVLKVDVTALSL